MAEQRCRICGCTWGKACPGRCYWVEPDLCSACVDGVRHYAASAVLSDCGLYRYQLGRRLSAATKCVTFIGVNPSTADAAIDDHTVRKWRGFATRWDFGSICVGNVFAYRATNVHELAKVGDPIGPENDQHLRAMLATADLVVPCWGSRTKIPKNLHHRIEAVRELLRECGRPIRVLGFTASGDPQHPLMIGYERELQDWIP